jgi:TolA-binding protein
MLALAAEREHQMDRARTLFAELNREFPANPVFAHELWLLQTR